MTISQRERSQANPLNLGKFDRTSVRLLTGTLGPKSQIINGGYGNDTYNHWFKITLLQKAFVLVIKAGTKLATSNVTPTSLFNQTTTRFTTAFYDINRNPIQERFIHQFPFGYKGTAAGAPSDLYNTFDPNKFNKGNELFYELEPGDYMICVSATRNELFQYGVGLVVEIPSNDEDFILVEDTPVFYVLQEAAEDSDIGSIYQNVGSPITSNVTLSGINGFTQDLAVVESGVIVQVNNTSPQIGALTWYIGPLFPSVDSDDRILQDVSEDYAETQIPDHSLTEWRTAWDRDHEYDNRFPSGVFAPYATSQ